MAKKAFSLEEAPCGGTGFFTERHKPPLANSEFKGIGI
jgi:hypothetical protein